MNVFFEESGSFKVGNIISKHGEAVYVELPGGRRLKVKGRDILIQFSSPEADEMIRIAQRQSIDIDPDFLWEVAEDVEFNIENLATSYFGISSGAIEYAALALRLQSLPIYFRRKGRGRYQRVPEMQLKAGLAALDRRKKQALTQIEYEIDLKEGRLPKSFHGKIIRLLARPDKNSIEYKALECAAAARGITPIQLMIECGGLSSPQAWLEQSFIEEYFPQGIKFPYVNIKSPSNVLPRNSIDAFSIDDATTTEIDDAFSVQSMGENHVRIGIHIAAPALGISPDDEIDCIARTRLSTVYIPGKKITMLPQSVIDIFTLKEGDYRPVLSLYFTVNKITQEILKHETLIETIFVKTNIRYNELENIVTETALSEGCGNYPHKDQIEILWIFSKALREKRQQTRIVNGLRRETEHQLDYNFYVDGDRIIIRPRLRGSPLDIIVSEMAILANSSWAEFLSKYDVPAIYRTQRSFGIKRTRLQTSPAPHEGLGVPQYAWSTSPLRRYVDLVNQWQLVALVNHGATTKLVAPFKPRDNKLCIISQNFEEVYSAYIEHQQKMERFWCLRWLEQERGGIGGEVTATIINGELIRLEEIPLQFLVPGIGIHPKGTRVLLKIVDINLLNVTISARLLRGVDVPMSVELSDEG